MSNIERVLARGRAMAESLMTDTCTITRAGKGKGPFNPATGQYDDPPRITVYGPEVSPCFGKCRVQDPPAGSSGTDVEAGDRTSGIETTRLQLPVIGSEAVAVNDVVEYLIATKDPALVGREFTVFRRHEKTDATKRSLTIRRPAS